MLGNVLEWTCTAYSERYDGSETKCENGGSQRVVRGGSWNWELGNLSSTFRYGNDPVDRAHDLGFRLAQD